MALHAQVVGHDAPVSWIWLGGACATATLYLTLALRGYGRLYLYPGLAATLVAWGSLAAVDVWRLHARLDLELARLRSGTAAARLRRLRGAALGMLTPLRRYDGDMRGTLIAILSWLPWLVALGAAAVELGARTSQPLPTEGLVRTREWVVLTLAVFSAAQALTAEGVRLGRRTAWVPGTAGLLGAALLAIAISRPENVQAYTLPAGFYLVALGLSFRRSLPVIGLHLYEHEALQIAGLLTLVLPAAQQALQAGGDRYALEVIAQGLIVLTIGFTLSARWLVTGGILALSAVAVRWLAAHGQDVPRWIPLGIVGMVLLALGILLLLERERWERLRRRVARWWLDAPQHAHL